MPVLCKLLVAPQTSGIASSRPSPVYLYTAFIMFIYVRGPLENRFATLETTCLMEKPGDPESICT